MNIKLSESEIKNIEELINSDDIECVTLANEIVSTLDKELQLKYQDQIYVRILYLVWKNHAPKINNPPWFFE